MIGRIGVAIEATPKKVFATAIDWPGWSRSGRTHDVALETLVQYRPRYATVALGAGEAFSTEASQPGDLEVVELADGGGGTAFGVPSRITDADRRPVSALEADRLRRLVAAAWSTFDRVAASAPLDLRKGPRGGGRDRDGIVEHIVEADHAYAREMGLVVKAPAPGDRAAIEAMRSALFVVIGSPSDGSPLAGRKWTVRYAAGRIAWHALDHAWEMEDRSQPA